MDTTPPPLHRPDHSTLGEMYVNSIEVRDFAAVSLTLQYITLFASAFPLGAAVTFVFLYIEVRSDLFKLLNAYRRPLPMRSENYMYNKYYRIAENIGRFRFGGSVQDRRTYIYTYMRVRNFGGF